MSKHTFWFVCARYGKLLQKEETSLRFPVPYAKRLAIVLHWLAKCLTFAQLSALYAISKSTAIAIVYEGITVLQEKLVPASIRFPTGAELEQVMRDLESLCGLPMCAGAIDGMFMQIKKPTEFGDSYYCYNPLSAVAVCVNLHWLSLSWP